MKRTKKILKGLDHAQYEHPFDKKALEILEGMHEMCGKLEKESTIGLDKS